MVNGYFLIHCVCGLVNEPRERGFEIRTHKNRFFKFKVFDKYSVNMKYFKPTLIIFFITQLSSAQTEIEIDNNFPLSLLTRSFENLNHGSELFEQYSILKNKHLYSIIGCIYLLEMEEEEMKKVAIARLKGISTQLFNEKKPVILTYGMDSVGFAMKKNENVEDDNQIVYLSIADCIVRNSEVQAQNAFNNQTRKLVSKKIESDIP